MDNIENKLISNLEKLRSERSNYDTVNQDIADYILFNRGEFTRTYTSGERKDIYIHDQTATNALEQASSIIYSGLTDPDSRWFNLRARNSKVMELDEVKRFFAEVHEELFFVFSSSELGFPSQNHEVIKDTLGFGGGFLDILEAEDSNDINFRSRQPGEIWMEENNKGFVDTFYREFKLTARQALQQFGEDALGDKIKEMLKTKPHEKARFLNILMPRKDYERMIGALDSSLGKFEIISITISIEDKNTVEKAGYHELPRIASRWTKRSGEVYPISPSWNILSTVKSVNAMEDVIIRTAQIASSPTLLVADDSVMLPLQHKPNGIIMGGVSDDGRPLVQPLITGADHRLGLEMLEKKRDEIKSAYFVDLFQQREGVQPLTATEVNDNRETRLRLLGPQIRRFMDEYLSKVITRVFGIRQRQGLLPEIPKALLDRSGQLNFEIEYISPLAFTQKSSSLLSYNRFLSAVGPFLQAKPDILDNLDLDKIARDAAEKSGIPIDQVVPPENVSQMREIRMQETARQQSIVDAQVGAETAASLSKAGINPLPQ